MQFGHFSTELKFFGNSSFSGEKAFLVNRYLSNLLFNDVKSSPAKLKTMFQQQPNYEEDPNISASGLSLASPTPVPVKSGFEAPKSVPQTSGDIESTQVTSTPHDDEAAQLAAEEAALAAEEAALRAAES